MLRKSLVLVFVRLRVRARENPFRFEIMHRTPGNPTTVSRVQQPAANHPLGSVISYLFSVIFDTKTI
jgi:hypothetical protein